MAINPNEIREDADSEEPTKLVWPQRDFPDPDDVKSGFKPGERFQYRGQWGVFRKVAQITISTEEVQSGDPSLLNVKTEAKTTGFIKALFPLMLKGETLLEPSEGRILENHVTDTGRSNEKDSTSTFDYETGRMKHVDTVRPERNQERDVPYPAPLDYASAILQIRGWDLEADTQHPLFISSNGKFYLIELETKATEIISTQFGKIEAYRVEPVSAYPQSKIFREGGKMSIWVSKDARRIPLRIDVNTSIGTASMRIEEFTLASEALVAQSQQP